MKAIVAALLVASTAQADLAAPDLQHDHQPVDLTAPQIGAEVLAIPGSSWLVAFNDEFGNADPDFNDAVAIVEFDGPSVAKLHYVLALSPYRAVLRFAFRGEPFTELGGVAHMRSTNDGHAVTIEMLTANGNATYFSGGPILNPDSRRHAYVARIK